MINNKAERSTLTAERFTPNSIAQNLWQHSAIAERSTLTADRQFPNV